MAQAQVIWLQISSSAIAAATSAFKNRPNRSEINRSLFIRSPRGQPTLTNAIDGPNPAPNP